MTLPVARMGREEERLDREFWAQLTPEERVEEAWKLTLELWELKGWDPGEPGLCRSLRALSAAEARFLIVGAYAVSFHSRPRATGDLDLWVDPAAQNAARVVRALREFGTPLGEIGERDFCAPDLVFQLGVPPRRIDLLTSLTELRFDEAWETRVAGAIGGEPCSFIGREALIWNKRVLGSPRDLADVEQLESAG